LNLINMEYLTQDYSKFESKPETELEMIAQDDTQEGHDAKFYLGIMMYLGLKPE